MNDDENTTKRVMIVEGDASVRNVLFERLRGYGLESEAVSSVGDALERVSRMKFLFVIMNCGMPGVDWRELHGKIRELKESIPVVLYKTGLSRMGRMTAPRCDDHLYYISRLGCGVKVCSPVERILRMELHAK